MELTDYKDMALIVGALGTAAAAVKGALEYAAAGRQKRFDRYSEMRTKIFR